MLGGESDSEGASTDFWVSVWVAKQLLELRIVVWCRLNEYRCGHVAIILQRYLLVRRYVGPPVFWFLFNFASIREHGLSFSWLAGLCWVLAQNVGIGTSNPQGKLHVYESAAPAWIILDGDGQNADLSPRSYGSGRPGVSCFRSRGTMTAPSAVQNNDMIGFIGGRGYGSTQFGMFSDAAVVFRAEGDFTDASHPAGITLETTPANSTTRVERVRISSEGYVGIGTSTPISTLHIVQTTPGTINPRGITLDSYANDPWAPQINQRKARGTPDAPLPVQSGDVLAAWWGKGYDGSGFSTPGQGGMRVRTAQDWTPTAHGTFMEFHTTPNNSTAPAVRVVISDIGDVGIGTTTPQARLDIRGGMMWGNGSISYPTTPAAPERALVGRGTASNYRIVVQDGTGRVNHYWNAYWDGTAHRYVVGGEAAERMLMSSGYISFEVAPPGTNDGDPITWTMAMRIDNDGDVGIGTTNPTYQLQLSLDAAAKPSTNTWTTISDARLKRIVGPYTKGLSELMQIQSIRYHYQNPSEDSLFSPQVLEKENVGFVAQEVARIFPEAVDTAANGYLGLNIHPILIAYLNAIQELKAENDSLRATLQQMQERMTALEQSLSRLHTQVPDTSSLPYAPPASHRPPKKTFHLTAKKEAP